MLAVRPSVRVRPSVSAAAAPVGRSAKHGGRTAHVKLVTCVLIAFNGSASKVRCPPLGLQFSSVDLGIVLTYRMFKICSRLSTMHIQSASDYDNVI